MSWAEDAVAELSNGRVLLRRVSESDRDGVRAIAMDSAIWRYFVSAVESLEDFEAFFDTMLADDAAGVRAVYIVVDRAAGEIAGSMSYGNLSQKDLRLEIGWSWLGLRAQGTGLNAQAKLLLLQQAFEVLGAERVEFKTDVLNAQARAGLVKIGAVPEGVFRSFNPMPGGRRRDAMFFSVIRAEWPATKAGLLGVDLAAVGSSAT